MNRTEGARFWKRDFTRKEKKKEHTFQNNNPEVEDAEKEDLDHRSSKIRDIH